MCNKKDNTIEIPFGAKDSELNKFEYTIPEGYEAEIKDGKVIVKKKESEDERIRTALLRCCDDLEKGKVGCIAKEDVPAIRAYLEKQKEQKPTEWSEEDETAFSDLMWCIEKARKSAKDENDMGNIWFAENWVKNRLKFLRPQPHWKPSEQ